MEFPKGDNERELTSTMDNVTSMSIKDEKSDTSDATPTSSTDANTSTARTDIVSDDPISSTSSDIGYQVNSKMDQNDISAPKLSAEDVKKGSAGDSENDLLGISNVSGEKITEDVEDLVHDLESLLGEPAPTFTVSSQHAKVAETKNVLADQESTSQVDDESSEEKKEHQVPEFQEKDTSEKCGEDENSPEIADESTVEEKRSDDGEIVQIESTEDVVAEEASGESSRSDEKDSGESCIIESSVEIVEIAKNEAESSSATTSDHCIQDQDITRSEPKEKEDCDRLEVTKTGCTDEDQASDSQDEVDTTVVSTEPDTVVTATEEIKGVPEEDTPSEEAQEVEDDSAEVNSKSKVTESTSDEAIEEADVEDVTDVDDLNAPETSDVILPTEDDSKQEKPESGDASLDEALPVIVENTELLPSAEKETKTESAEPSADDKTVLDSELVLEHESNPCVEAENNSTEPVDTGAPDIDSDPAENAEESDVAENSPKVVSDATVSQVADEEHDSGDCEVPNEEEKTESVEPSESGDVKLDSGPQSVEAGDKTSCGKDENEELVAGDCEPSQTDDVTAEDADKAVNSTSDTVEQNEVATSEEDKNDEDLKEPVESDFQAEPVTIAENCELADIQDTDETVVTKEVRAEVVVEADTNSDDSKDQSNDVDSPPTDTEEILSSADLKSTKVTPVEQSEAQEVSGSPEAPTSVENLEADKKCEDKTVCISDDEQESPMVESPQEDTPSKLNAVAQKPKYVEPGPLNLSEESDEEDIPTLVLDVEPPAADVVVTNQEEEEVADTATPEAPTLPEVEDILINSEIVHPGVSEQHIAPDNLETILAVASLQNIDVPKGEERLLTEKERREMEALRKAVESITEPGSDYENVADEFIPEIEQAENAEVPTETVVESEAIGQDSDEVEMIVESEEIKSVEPVSVENDVGFEVPDEESDTSKDLDSVAKENDIEALPAPKSDVNNEEGDSAASVNSIEGISDQNLDNEANVSSVNKNGAEDDSDEVKEATDTVVEVHDDNQVEEAKSEVVAEVVENNLSKQSDMTENVLPDSSQTVSEPETDSVGKESKTKANERPKRFRKATDSKLEELSINVDVPDKEKPYSPKITIKPIKVPDEEVSTTSNSDSELVKGSLKMTITKQSDKMHSIVKMSEAEASEPAQEQEDPLPKLKIKPKFQVEPQKMSTRSSKQVASSSNQRSGSPRITIKPVVKPEKQETLSPLKIKIGLKSEEPARKHSPKFNIKPIAKPDEEQSKEVTQSPRKVLIKPIVKPPEEMDQPPKITIKPIPKPEPEKEITITPKLNIKPIKKPEEEVLDTEHERSSPKIIIKPIVKPQESEAQSEERIVLKINKGNIESKKRERQEEERLAKITVKISKEGGHHIVQPEDCQKRPHEESNYQEKNKKQKVEVELVTSTRSRVKETPAETIGDSKGSPVETRSKHKDVSVESPKPKDNPVSPASKHKDPTLDSPVELKRAKLRDSKQKENIDHRNEEAAMIERKLDSPIVISDDSRSQDSGSCLIINDSSRNTPVSDVSTESAKVTPETSVSNAAPVPKKRGRPRKVPLEVRPDFKDDDLLPQPVKEEPLAPTVPVHESGRPKRSCRGQSALDTLGLKPRKPRGPGRGRGSARGMGTRAVAMKPQKEPKVSKAKLKLMQRAAQAQLKKAGGFDAKTAVDVEDLLPQSHVEKSEPVIVAAVVTDDQEPSTSGLSNNPQGDGNKDEDRLCQVEGKTGDVERRAENENNPVERGNPGHYPKTEEDKERADDISSELIKHLNQGNPVPLLEEVSSTSLDPADLPASQDQDMLVIEPVLPAVISSKPSNPELPKETSLFPESPHTPNAAVTVTSTTTVPAEVVMVDEETRMSAEAGSRAQTPARQMVAPSDVVEESQSSVQSTATTESGKQTGSRPTKAPRLEVQEPEGSVINADQLTEYYWNGNGPFMLQEQVAQYLGIKSFKRKYPSIKRRMLEMQERDFIKENGLASEHMCDLGLTAVNSADILDIMYSDFQEKYEEYCKHQRDRQAKELINKQRALSLAASQDKNKADITQQAVHSAAQWNANFNRARKEQRRACMDLQTLTVHYPKGRMKKIDKSPVGNYPVALVPGQFTDYYRDFTPTEINNLPLNTMCYNEVHKIPPEESEESDSDGSSSDSDSSDGSSSGSDSSSSSEVEDCKLCKHSPKKVGSGKMI